MRRGLLGVLGGMGPLATADFFTKLIEETPATDDHEHIPVLLSSDPRIPSRPAAILANGRSPLGELIAQRDRLIGAGATALAMPCNTAHYWFDALTQDCAVPFLSIVDASLAMLPQEANDAPVGLVATRATLVGQIFDHRLTALGHEVIVPTEEELATAILPSIKRVKENRKREAGDLLVPAVHALFDRGARAVILACTETPIALEAIDAPILDRCIDTNRALARACVRHWSDAA